MSFFDDMEKALSLIHIQMCIRDRNHTNIYEIKKIAKDFLYMKIIITDLSPMFVVHPFFENGIILSETKDKIFNIVENKKDLQFILLQMEKKIDQS